MPPKQRERIFVAVPTRGSVACQTASRLEAIRDRNPQVMPIFYQPGAASVAYNRNLCVHYFLEHEECGDQLVFVDDDVVPPMNFLEALLPVPDGYGIIGVPYPIGDPKSGVPMLCVYEMHPEHGIRAGDIQEGLNECDAVATGCCAIPRKVLEEFGSNCFRFDADPIDVFHGEDILFCRDLHERGHKVGYTTTAGFCDHIRVTSLEPIVGLVGLLMSQRKEQDA